jgi:hypothetical protein
MLSAQVDEAAKLADTIERRQLGAS